MLLRETTHPHDDVVELKARLETLAATLEAQHNATEQAQEALTRDLDTVRSDQRAEAQRWREDLRLTRESVQEQATRVRTVDQGVDTLRRHFDEAVDGVTDQRELLAGIRAFVRLVRTGPMPA